MSESSKQVKIHLTLVRHAATEANILHFPAGHVDYPLADIGKEQANETGKILKDERYDIVMSSDLKRAHQTAKIILDHAKYDGDIEQYYFLRDRTLGIYDGKKNGMAEHDAEAFAAGYKMVENGLFSYNEFVPCRGESSINTLKRVLTFMDMLQKRACGMKDGTNILIVSHCTWIIPFVEKYCFENDCQDLPFDGVKCPARPLNAGYAKFTMVVDKITGNLVSLKCLKYF